MTRPDVGVMRELLFRVENAESGLFLLNAQIGKAIEPNYPGAWPDYTTSIDAAVALVERTLPGAVWHVMTDYGDLNRAKIGPVGRPNASVYRVEDRTDFSFGDGDTPPLAICAALLTALIAAEDRHV